MKTLSTLEIKGERMHKFTINSNHYLSQNIVAYYHSTYTGGQNRWQLNGTIENLICTLKNDITPYPQSVLTNKVNDLKRILNIDLPIILKDCGLDALTVCVVPRAKTHYLGNQLLFRSTICDVVNGLSNFINGTDYINRTTDTRTTHRDRSGHGGNGDLPYVGITKATCNIDAKIKDNDILLIDDLYTKSINIDEDAIQALIDLGANSVIFYAIGYTI
jgi:hypothetical protein